MSYIVVDVESDGEIIGQNSMVCFGAVHIDKEEKLNNTFYGETAPISGSYKSEALAISGFGRRDHEQFPLPKETMSNFLNWLKQFNKPVLISDNNGYDAAWINYYLLKYAGENPFGWSSRRIGDMFAGFMNDPHYRWKKHRKTEHTHHPVDDAKGNAEALLWLRDQGFKIKFK